MNQPTVRPRHAIRRLARRMVEARKANRPQEREGADSDARQLQSAERRALPWVKVEKDYVFEPRWHGHGRHGRAVRRSTASSSSITSVPLGHRGQGCAKLLLLGHHDRGRARCTLQNHESGMCTSPRPVRQIQGLMTSGFRAGRREVRRAQRRPDFKFERRDLVPDPLRDAGRDRLLLEQADRGWRQESQCGWLKDKFGLSWQVTPVALIEMLSGGDAAGAQRVTKAFLQMKKFDLAALKRAYEGKS